MIEKKFKKLIGFLIVSTVFYFLIRGLYENWHQVSNYNWEFNYLCLGWSFVVLLSYCALLTILWKLILERLEEKNVSIRKGYKYWSLSQLGRYLPGKFWLVLGRVYLCNKEGFSKSATTASIIMELILTVLAGVFVFLLALPFMKFSLTIHHVYWLLLLIPIGLVSIHPLLFSKLFNFILRKLKRTEIRFDISYSQIVSFIALYMIMWLVCGLAFFLFVNSLYHVGWSKFVGITGTFAIAWVIGFVSFITPAGLGVRELALSVLLANYMPVPMAIVVALVSRIWLTAAELVCAAVAWRL